MRAVWLSTAILMACGGPGQTPRPGVPDAPDETVPVNPGDPGQGARTVPQYGGTLATHSSGLVVVADPIRDSVGFTNNFRTVVELDQGAEPFRVAIDDDRVYVTLRGTGQVKMFDHSGTELATQGVCDHPRGLDIGASLFVACAGGEVVELDPTDLSIVDTHHYEPDLRDVVIDGGHLLVSRFRAAEVLRIDLGTMAVIGVLRPNLSTTARQGASGTVAWRMVGHPDGGALLLHQSSSNEEIELVDPTDPAGNRGEGGAYGSGQTCEKGGGRQDPNNPDDPDGDGPLVQAHLTRIEGGVALTSGPLGFASVPVDVAISPDGSQYAVAASFGFERNISGVFVVSAQAATDANCVSTNPVELTDGMMTSVAWHARGGVASYDRQHGWLVSGDLQIPDRAWTGDEQASRLFHDDPGAGLACASCHPEGQDDGHVWNFAELGPRRTQNLGGGVMSRGTFHWDAEFDSIESLMNDVFVQRMGGNLPGLVEIEDLEHWLDGIPSISATPTATEAALTRGQELFESTAVGCAACHSGPQLADHALHTIATGQPPTKTPSLLGVGTRAPFMHTGCADTMLERLANPECGGDLHGDVSGLSATDLEALSAYVMSL